MEGRNEKFFASLFQADLLAEALDKLQKHQYEEAEALACKVIEKAPEDGAAHCIRLFASAKVIDPMQLPDEILSDPDNILFRNAFDYSSKEMQNLLLAAKANSVSGKLLDQAQKEENAGHYDQAYEYYKTLGKRLNGFEKAKEMRYKQGENAYATCDYEKAVQYFKEAAGCADSRQKLQLATQALEVRKAFDAEIGNQYTYIDKQMQALYPAEIKQYRKLEKTVNSASWCHGVAYLIAAMLMVLASAAMCVDVNENNSFIYLLFGVCWAFVIHKVFDWDFGLIKSCLTGYLCAAAPFALRAVSDALFDTETPGFFIIVCFSSIVFLRALLQQIHYIRAKNVQKKKVQYRITVIDPRINAIRKELVEKYSAQLDRSIVEKWVRTLTLR